LLLKTLKARQMGELNDIILLASKGLLKEALDGAYEIQDTAERAEAFLEIALRANGIRGEVERIALEEATKLLKKLKDSYDRAYLYSKAAYVHYLIGDGDSSSEFFEKAADEIAKIKDVKEKVLSLGILAYYLALSGLPEEALSQFNDAFEMAVSANIDYRSKIDLLIELGGLIENTGDALHSKDALEFYQMAYDIFDKLYVSHRAAEVEKKLELAKTVYLFGDPEIRKALLEGRYRYAVSLLQKTIDDPQKLLIALLEVSAWLKKVGSPEYLDVLEAAFRLFDRIGLSDKNVQRAAAILTDMGELEKALEFARKIADPEKRDEALAAISLKLAERGEFLDARDVVSLVSDSMMKAKLLQEIAKMEKEKHGEEFR
jgi:tetratricopeptide (TPR) repeat protein